MTNFSVVSHVHIKFLNLFPTLIFGPVCIRNRKGQVDFSALVKPIL